MQVTLVHLIGTDAVRTVFPLSHIYNTWSGYYIDAKGTVYSSLKTKRADMVHQLGGVGGVGGACGTSVSLRGCSYPTSRLLSMARGHASWSKELEPTVKAETKAVVAPSPEIKQNVLQAVKDRGFVIASIVDNVLLFGSAPKIHATDELVEAELKRLAAAKPGTVFVKLAITAALVSSAMTRF